MVHCVIHKWDQSERKPLGVGLCIKSDIEKAKMVPIMSSHHTYTVCYISQELLERTCSEYVNLLLLPNVMKVMSSGMPQQC